MPPPTCDAVPASGGAVMMKSRASCPAAVPAGCSTRMMRNVCFGTETSPRMGKDLHMQGMVWTETGEPQSVLVPRPLDAIALVPMLVSSDFRPPRTRDARHAGDARDLARLVDSLARVLLGSGRILPGHELRPYPAERPRGAVDRT